MKFLIASEIFLVGVISTCEVAAFSPPSKNFVPNQFRQQPINFPIYDPLETRLGSSPVNNPPGSDLYPSPELNRAENARPFRRTVYSHEDWVRHRSTDRFSRNLSTMVDSAVVGNVAKESLSVASFATFLVFWNSICGDYQGLMNGLVGPNDGVVNPGPLKDVFPTLELPLNVFQVASSSLGLLLAFRVNNAYKRWDEARKNWGMNINHTRDLVRMGNAYYDRSVVSPEVAREDLDRLALCTWAFVRSMKRHLSPEWEDEAEFRREMLEKLPQQQAEGILNAAHRPNRALQDLSVAIENMPMHSVRKNEIQKAVTIFEDNLGSSERLLTSPIPLFYSKVTARALWIWMLALPLGLYGVYDNTWNHLPMIPTSFFIALFLFGIEELATQLEEPFTILPMQAFCDKIYNWCNEIASFEPGDNGMPVYQYNNRRLNTGPGMPPPSGYVNRVSAAPATASMPSSGIPAESIASPSTAPITTMDQNSLQYSQDLNPIGSGATATAPIPAPSPAVSEVPQPVVEPAPSATLSPYEQYLQIKRETTGSASVPVPTPIPAPSPVVSEVAQPVEEPTPSSTLSPYEQYLQIKRETTGSAPAPAPIPSVSEAFQQVAEPVPEPVAQPAPSATLSPYEQYLQIKRETTGSAPTPAPAPTPTPVVSEESQLAAEPAPSTTTLSPYEQYLQIKRETTATTPVPVPAPTPAPSPVVSEISQPVVEPAPSATLSPYEQYMQIKRETTGSVPVPAPSPVVIEVSQPVAEPTPSTTLSPYEQYLQIKRETTATPNQYAEQSSQNANSDVVTFQSSYSSTPDQYAQQSSGMMSTSSTSSSTLDVALRATSTSSASSSTLDVSQRAPRMSYQPMQRQPKPMTNTGTSSSSLNVSRDEVTPDAPSAQQATTSMSGTSSSAMSMDALSTQGWTVAPETPAQESMPQIRTTSTSSSTLNVSRSRRPRQTSGPGTTTTLQATQGQPAMTMAEYTQSLKRSH